MGEICNARTEEKCGEESVRAKSIYASRQPHSWPLCQGKKSVLEGGTAHDRFFREQTRYKLIQTLNVNSPDILIYLTPT